MRRRSSVLALAFLAMALLFFGAGEVLSQPALRCVGAPPQGMSLQTVTIVTTHGGVVSGWMAPGEKGMGAVLLLHGVRSDRTQMLARARFLQRQGYAVLLIDLPAHGESVAAHITYGVNESQGVGVALDFLARSFPNERIGMIGVSLGAASAVLSSPVKPPDAMVLESMFPTIDEAVSNRLRHYLGPAGGWLTPLLLWQMPLRLGISTQQLRPIDALAAMRTPVLIASGDMDRSTTLAETHRLYAAAREPKELWIVQGAGHVDLEAFDPATYEKTISTFLANHLRTR